MIKFTAKGNGRQLVGLGITERNVEELKKGHPILVRLRDLDIPTNVEVAIFYGRDERVIHDQIKDFIAPSTVVKGDAVVDNQNGVN